jgi:DNA-binding MarR family transcriptional regulator
VLEIPDEMGRAGGELRALIGRLSRRLRQAYTDDEITLSQASVLKRLEQDGPATPVALASVERVRPQSMGATLATLEALGMVSRRPDPRDGRSVVMSLTPAGQQALDGVRRNRAEQLGRALSEGFTPDEQQTLLQAIPLLDRLSRMV